MTWRAVVPIKAAPDRKMRLAASLLAEERAALTNVMLENVCDALRQITRIEAIGVLAPVPVALPGIEWVEDRGRGLNAECDALAAAENRPLLLIHADLPFVRPEEIERLLDLVQEPGIAFAEDRHGRGTNAVALAESVPFRFAFGPGSLARHLAANPGARTLRSPGLATDIDDPADLALLPAEGRLGAFRRPAPR